MKCHIDYIDLHHQKCVDQTECTYKQPPYFLKECECYYDQPIVNSIYNDLLEL